MSVLTTSRQSTFGWAQHDLSQLYCMLLGHTEIVHCDKCISFLKKKQYRLACQGLSAHWQKSHSFENFLRWDENKGESKWCITEP